MPKYVVHYFDVRGRAEIIRLLLAAGGQEFEDKRYTMDEWKQCRDSTPTGQLPMLEIDGKKYPQTMSLARHVAMTYGFAGKDEMERFKCDIVVDCIMTFWEKIIAFQHVITDEKDREAARKVFREEQAPQNLRLLEKHLSDSGHFVGDSLTWADVMFADTLLFMTARQFIAGIDDFPKLQKVKANVEAQPGIAAWIAKRPVTPF